MKADLVVFCVFIGLTTLTLAQSRSRNAALERSPSEWGMDWLCLFCQGFLVPVLQATLVYSLLEAWVPSLRGSLKLPGVVAFILNFVLVDYAYYWNHRALHQPILWRIHQAHHSAEIVDVFTTSRNLLWAPLFIVYLWLNGLIAFLLGDPRYFLLAASLTSALDLWRHSRFGPEPGSVLHRILSPLLITPHEHHWHHSRDSFGANFGANLSLWDRIHKSYLSPPQWPSAYGAPDPDGARPVAPLRRLLLP